MKRDDYDIYEKSGIDPFAGGWTQHAIVEKKTGKLIAHFWGWEDPSVVHEWNPLHAMGVGFCWKFCRPKGFRKMRPSYRRDVQLDACLDLLLDLR